MCSVSKIRISQKYIKKLHCCIKLVFQTTSADKICVIYYISAVVTQHIKPIALLELFTFGYMFRPLPGHHQANKE